MTEIDKQTLDVKKQTSEIIFKKPELVNKSWRLLNKKAVQMEQTPEVKKNKTSEIIY